MKEVVKRYPKIHVDVPKTISLEQQYMNLKQSKETELKNNLDFLTFRNLVIKQLILKAEMTYSQIGAQFLPPLCEDSIRMIAKQMGVRRNRTHNYSGWSENDINILKNDYGKIPSIQLAYKFNRSIGSVHVKASQLGLTKQGPGARYSNEDDEFIKNNLHMPLEEMATHFCRTPRGLKSHIKKMGLFLEGWVGETNHWSGSEVQFLIDNQHLRRKEIQKSLNRSEKSIIKKQRRLGIVCKYKHNR